MESTRLASASSRSIHDLLLLELGIGLRRHESDKSQWDWLFTDKSGRHFIEVRKTEYFTPKGKRRRILPVEPVLWDALQETRGMRCIINVAGPAASLTILGGLESSTLAAV